MFKNLGCPFDHICFNACSLDSTPRSSRLGPSITVSKPDGAEGPPTVISHRERKNSDPGATNEDPEVTVDKGMIRSLVDVNHNCCNECVSSKSLQNKQDNIDQYSHKFSNKGVA